MASPWAQQWQQPQQQFNAQLPPGWDARYDASKGRYYFINHATQETTWIDPRTQVPQRQARQPASVVEIPLQELSPATRGHSSTTQPQETTFGISELLNTEDQEWQDDLLRRAMDTVNEKQDVKEKLKKEFKELDESEVDTSVELCNYKEDEARKMLQNLQNEIKRRKERRAEEERMEQERIEKREAEQRRHEIERKQKEKLDELEEKCRRSAAQASTSSVTTKRTPVVTNMVSNRTPVTTKKEPTRNAVTNSRQQITQTSGRNKAYVSKNRVVTNGPQASLRKGPNPDHLLSACIRVAGSNKMLVAGPQKGNVKGPCGAESRVPQSQGPQPSLHQGPQRHLLVKGSMFGVIQPPIMSTV